MRRVFLLRYKVKPEHAAENEQLVRAVFDEIHRARPEAIRYSTFLLDDVFELRTSTRGTEPAVRQARPLPVDSGRAGMTAAECRGAAARASRVPPRERE